MPEGQAKLRIDKWLWQARFFKTRSLAARQVSGGHVRVNGERWGGGNSGQMQHDFGAILAHISASETLYPGEVIGSGTVGTGCGLETGKRLAPGDMFELEIERIGTLVNRIVKP